MTKPTNTQSQKRFKESLSSLFVQEGDKASHLFIKSSSDIGVVRNGGRNGARFAPKSFLSFFKRLALDLGLENLTFKEVEVSNEELEINDFNSAQKTETEKIKSLLSKHAGVQCIHLGGGHDHIYPLLMAQAHKPQIIVINIDAHADTRTDEHFHSGTPFRQFSEDYSGDFSIFQIGLHPFANSLSTLSPLKKGDFQTLWREELSSVEKIRNFFSEIKKKVSPETVMIFSLDADALSGEIVPGVSAVNGDGISIETLKLLWDQYLLLGPQEKILGIYELNPLYDTLSGISMRSISSFVFHTLKK